MKNPIRVWRCPENAEVVRALENLQALTSGIKDTEIDHYEAEEEHVETRYIQKTVKEGTANGNQRQ